ncbi:MAG TPA: hypothetical protein VFE17_09130 [Candidatus Baltobacteraceae bacterium]|jgi:hypothetical protein|nr:hypothetical protein [Candidatus Baltobacteraceae bacterium]
MSVFGNYAPGQVADAAEKFISKMDEGELARAIEQSERTMSAASRSQLVEAIFEAFRHRGESSDDVVEGAGTTMDAVHNGDQSAVRALLTYANTNAGLLKEATTALIERHPMVTGELDPSLARGIAQRLPGR